MTEAEPNESIKKAEENFCSSPLPEPTTWQNDYIQKNLPERDILKVDIAKKLEPTPVAPITPFQARLPASTNPHTGLNFIVLALFILLGALIFPSLARLLEILAGCCSLMGLADIVFRILYSFQDRQK